MPQPKLFKEYLASVKITTTLGNPIYYTITAGSVPPGLYLNTSNGDLAGLPTLAGVYSFTIAVMDSQGSTQSQPYQLTVAP